MFWAIFSHWQWMWPRTNCTIIQLIDILSQRSNGFAAIIKMDRMVSLERFLGMVFTWRALHINNLNHRTKGNLQKLKGAHPQVKWLISKKNGTKKLSNGKIYLNCESVSLLTSLFALAYILAVWRLASSTKISLPGWIGGLLNPMSFWKLGDCASYLNGSPALDTK